MKKIIVSFFKKIRSRKVLVHCENGNIVLKVYRGEIIRVPWFTGYCPFHLEKDGSVTLRLMWGSEPSRGFGKTWSGITWEEIK